MIYLCAGVYAEGASDYAFLLPLVTRVLVEASVVVPEMTDVVEAVGIDAPRPFPKKRAERVAAAIRAYESQCTLFVLHADADSDAEAAIRERVEPARRAAATQAPIVACVPVRELEAWLLSDRGAFVALVHSADPTLPRDPEAVTDPKRKLDAVLGEVGLHGRPRDYFRVFGERIDLERLRRLPAFCRFEAEIRRAVESLGHGGPARRR